MVVGFTKTCAIIESVPITTNDVSLNPVRVEKDMDTSDDPKICEIRSIPYGFQG
jgi:hypothetical protein